MRQPQPSPGLVGVATSTVSAGSPVAINVYGLASCQFDGATTAGDYVQASTTTGGECHDAGSTYPTSNQIVGTVLSTNGSTGVDQVFLFGVEIRGTSPGGAGTVTSVATTAPISGGTFTTSGIISCLTCLVSGGALGTPSSATLTNATGLPISGVSGLGTGVATFLAAPTSTNLRTAVATVSTGSGSLVFSTSPTLVTPALGTPSGVILTNATGLPASAITGTINATEVNGAIVPVSATSLATNSNGQIIAGSSGSGTVTIGTTISTSSTITCPCSVFYLVSTIGLTIQLPPATTAGQVLIIESDYINASNQNTATGPTLTTQGTDTIYDFINQVYFGTSDGGGPAVFELISDGNHHWYAIIG